MKVESQYIAFIPNNGYHTYNLWLIAQEVEKLGFSYKFYNIDHMKDEGVGKTAQKLGLETQEFYPGFLLKSRPAAVVTMNDWGTATKWTILFANSLGIPTFSIVEGVQDFHDRQIENTLGVRKRYPYTRAKYPLLIGKDDLNYIPYAEPEAIVGAARFDELFKQRESSKERGQTTPRALINLNFSYGVSAEHGKRWLIQTVEACKKLNLDFVISQHIADKTDTLGLEVSRRPFLTELEESTVLVSRFSSCILEALILNKSVVYFNNFNEAVVKFHEPHGAYPVAKNKAQLESALGNVEKDFSQYQSNFDTFLNHHVAINREDSSAHKAATYISNRLQPLQKDFYQVTSEVFQETLRLLELYHHF